MKINFSKIKGTLFGSPSGFMVFGRYIACGFVDDCLWVEVSTRFSISLAKISTTNKIRKLCLCNESDPVFSIGDLGLYFRNERGGDDANK